jgi:hypothetical protein
MPRVLNEKLNLVIQVVYKCTAVYNQRWTLFYIQRQSRVVLLRRDMSIILEDKQIWTYDYLRFSYYVYKNYSSTMSFHFLNDIGYQCKIYFIPNTRVFHLFFSLNLIYVLFDQNYCSYIEKEKKFSNWLFYSLRRMILIYYNAFSHLYFALILYCAWFVYIYCVYVYSFFLRSSFFLSPYQGPIIIIYHYWVPLYIDDNDYDVHLIWSCLIALTRFVFLPAHYLNNHLWW